VWEVVQNVVGKEEVMDRTHKFHFPIAQTSSYTNLAFLLSYLDVANL
jgi:hypothetical protein